MDKLEVQCIYSSKHSEYGQGHSQCIIKHQRMEGKHHVLHLQPPEEVPEKEPRYLENIRTVLYPGLFTAVPCGMWYIDHAESPDVEFYQQVVAIAVLRVDIIETDSLQRPCGYCGEAVLGVHHLPVAGGHLGEEGEDGVTEEAPCAHALPVDGADQAVAHGVVALAVDDRVEELREECRVHLVVAGHHGGDLDAVGEGGPVAGDDRCTDTAVLRVADGDNSGVLLRVFLDDRQRPVLRAVVDHVDLLHECRDGIERLADEELLVVCRNNHGDAAVPVSWG